MSGLPKRSAFAIAVLALGGSLAPAAPEQSDPNVALAREQLALIDRAFKDMDMMKTGGQLNLSDAKFALWGRRQLEALHAARAGKNDIIRILTRYRERMKTNEEYVKHAHQAGEATRIELYDAEYRRLEAEMWLNEERAR
jgi:hypothetical protein